MSKHLVITVSGPDRPGIVDRVTQLLVEHEGNVEASRMARLGGEFAVLMMVSIADDQFDDLRGGIRDLREEGFKVTTRETERGYSAKYAGWMPYELAIKGADHQGIIHQLAHYLAQNNINIETMDTDVVKAPMSGTPLFKMSAVVLVPPQFNYQTWRQALDAVGDELGVDVTVAPYAG